MVEDETPIYEPADYTINVKCPFCKKEHRDREVDDFDCECGTRIKIVSGWGIEAWEGKDDNSS